MSNIDHADDTSFFNAVLNTSGIVLVEFGAQWCGPCKKQLPILEQLLAECPDVKIVLVDVDDSPTITAKLSIRSVPTLVLFKDGQKINSLVGLTNLSKLKSLI